MCFFTVVELIDFRAVPPFRVVRELVLPAVRVACVEGLVVAFRAVLAGEDVGTEAIASIRGAGLRVGAVARTCLTAVVCSSSVVRNSWCPSGLATKYRYGTLAG
ncbi:MAG TPA: hypothetical protein VGG96_09725, partial [Steroidobacteraceae bacterium]